MRGSQGVPSKDRRLVRLLAATIFLAGGAGADEPARTVLEDTPGDGEYAQGAPESCLVCHDQTSVTAILKGPHAVRGDRRTPFAKHACETCHGPGAGHVASPGPMPVRFGPEHPAQAQNAVCLGCHQGGARIHWAGSPHESHDVACAACHDVHAEQDRVLTKDVRPETFVKDDASQVCFGCHPQVRAQLYRRSAHPLRQGRVACSGCHAVHGSVTRALLTEETLNETCYECHAEKRGPFLWEHTPAREDCLNCHVPHGSNHPALLEARTPWLCQECHAAAFHPSSAYTGAGLPGNGTPNRNLLLRNCQNCHTEVHGSNHPSGVRLTR